MRESKKIVFFGLLPGKNPRLYGGGELGNQRTVNMFKEFGYNVSIIRKTGLKNDKTRLVRYTTYPFRFIYDTVRIFIFLLFSTRKKLVHYSGFAGASIFVENIQTSIIKMLGYKLVYELRGGGGLYYFKNSTEKYRKLFSKVVNRADFIFAQGEENIPIINQLTKTKCCHYPNIVEDNFMPSVCPPKEADTVNLIFFGRIQIDKHVLLIVEVASILQKKMKNVTLTVIGNGPAEYREKVMEMMENRLAAGTYRMIPGCTHDELKGYLSSMHFFIFPSTQPLEGQSNSLTEAMSYGIIPIVSPQGFNKSTVGDDMFVVNELSAEKYAESILDLIDNNDITDLSKRTYNRIRNHYTKRQVYDRIKDLYDSL